MKRDRMFDGTASFGFVLVFRGLYIYIYIYLYLFLFIYLLSPCGADAGDCQHNVLVACS